MIDSKIKLQVKTESTYTSNLITYTSNLIKEHGVITVTNIVNIVNIINIVNIVNSANRAQCLEVLYKGDSSDC